MPPGRTGRRSWACARTLRRIGNAPRQRFSRRRSLPRPLSRKTCRRLTRRRRRRRARADRRGNHRHRHQARGSAAGRADRNQAFNTKTLDDLQVDAFDDYAKLVPSLSYKSAGPGSSNVYFRGVASGDNANHSTSLPSVGTYLDEQPITTIQGALDVHVFDIARVEALAGPQGTLYGASSGGAPSASSPTSPTSTAPMGR